MYKLALHNGCDQMIADRIKIDNKCFAVAEIFRSHPMLSVIIRKNQTKTDLARYLHAAWFFPIKSTWKKGIENNHFSKWPGLTSRLILKHLPRSQATVQGHIRRENKGCNQQRNLTKHINVRWRRLN